MELIELEDRTPPLLRQLVAVWKASVTQTHLFLSAAEIAAIQAYVPQALLAVPHLVTANNDRGRPVAFMGIDGQKLEMLFVAPQERGQGVGKLLLTYGMRSYGVRELCVNEQNPAARGFYEHLGFQVHRRSETDEQGMPYPILYMERP